MFIKSVNDTSLELSKAAFAKLACFVCKASCALTVGFNIRPDLDLPGEISARSRSLPFSSMLQICSSASILSASCRSSTDVFSTSCRSCHGARSGRNSDGANVLLDCLARWTRRSTRRKETENQTWASIRLPSGTSPNPDVDPISTRVPIMTLLALTVALTESD